jgi:hypothetical protein
MKPTRRLVETVARAIVDAHPSAGGRYARYDDWLREAKLRSYEGEMAREWLAARRREARAVLAVLAHGQQARTEG